LLPFGGAAGLGLPAVAKLLFLNPVANQMFAWRAADPRTVSRLLEGTGSRIDLEGLDCYARLFRTTGHVAGALGMMAHWDLNGLMADLPRLAPPMTLVAAQNDLAVPPRVSRRVCAMAPGSRLVELPGLGHLAHEESPVQVANIIRQAMARPERRDEPAASRIPTHPRTAAAREGA
jgi:magnesium chelatase accessory protein